LVADKTSNYELDISDGALLERVDGFSFLSDMLDTDGGCDSVVTAMIRSAWKYFLDYLLILTTY